MSFVVLNQGNLGAVCYCDITLPTLTSESTILNPQILFINTLKAYKLS